MNGFARFSVSSLLIGGNPFQTTAIYCLIAFLEQHYGVHFAMGGTGRLVDGLVGLIEGQGGEVRCGAEVESIVVEGDWPGASGSPRRVYSADIVVSNADSAWTYRRLLPPSARRRWTDRKSNARAIPWGVRLVFRREPAISDVKHHTILMGPRYRELLADIFKRKTLASDFSLYLHRPTATDPSLAPSGCDAFYALSPVPNLEGGQDWSELGEAYRQSIARTLEATLLPGLGQAIVTSKFVTPQSFQDRLCSFRGAGFGLEPVLTQSAWFRPHNRSEDVGNLFLVGAGTHPGAGLPGVLSSARILDKVAPDAQAFA